MADLKYELERAQAMAKVKAAALEQAAATIKDEVLSVEARAMVEKQALEDASQAKLAEMMAAARADLAKGEAALNSGWTLPIWLVIATLAVLAFLLR